MNARYTAVHIGRRGEVAGGMTQVVNGYLQWRFERFETTIVVSRDGSSGLRAAAIALRAAVQLMRLGDRDRTVVVAHLSQGGAFVREGLLIALARRRGFATVAQLHGSSFAAFARARPGLVKAVLRQARVILTLSDETTAAAARFVPASSVVQLPNAVAPGSPKTKERLVVFGGAVSRRKGVDVLAGAWSDLGAATDGWRLIVAGPQRDDVIPTDGVPRLEAVGAIDHDRLMDLLDRSSIAVLPSRDEAMPMFLLEAMARSNSVVSTTVGGIPELLVDGAGSLVPPGDRAALAEALRPLITDAEVREQAARRARARFDDTYSAAAVFPRVEDAWMRALERH